MKLILCGATQIGVGHNVVPFCVRNGVTPMFFGHKRIGVGLSVLIVGNGQLQRFVGWRGIQTNATNAVVSLTWRETI